VSGNLKQWLIAQYSLSGREGQHFIFSKLPSVCQRTRPSALVGFGRWRQSLDVLHISAIQRHIHQHHVPTVFNITVTVYHSLPVQHLAMPTLLLGQHVPHTPIHGSTPDSRRVDARHYQGVAHRFIMISCRRNVTDEGKSSLIWNHLVEVGCKFFVLATIFSSKFYHYRHHPL
jgi:hypothetical protein